MKIAYFSPMPSAKTGIATYSSHLVPELAARSELTVFSPGASNWQAPANCRIVDFKANPFVLKSLDDYDQVIYHLGNNPWFHLEIYQVFLQWPGYVVLHDLVLYYLIAGLGRGGLIKEFCDNYGFNRINEVWALIDSCPENNILRYQSPASYPFLKRVLEQAKGIVVHNNASAEQLAKLGRVEQVHVLPLIFYPEQKAVNSTLAIASLRGQLGVGTDELLLGVFGFIGPTKRIGQVLKAVRALLDEKPHLAIKILIIGEGDSLKDEIETCRLREYVIELGFVADDKFTAYLNAVDIVANLRYPSMGESSASLIQAMSFAKPVIVTNHASFAELPDNVVAKVSYGENEISEITHVLRLLVEDEGLRESLGQAALEYVETYCAPDKVATLYLGILQKKSVLSDRKNQDKFVQKNIDPQWAEKYMYQRVSNLMPSRK